MKNLCALLLLITLILTSCTAGKTYKSDDQIVDDIVDPLISAISTRDKNAIKNLFSANAIRNDATFDDDICALLDYCQGQLDVYDRSSLGASSEQKHGDYRRKTIEKNYELDADNVKYRVYVYVVATDTSNPDEVGLCSFYIIKVNENMDLKYSYKGDLKNTPGINIGIENAQDDARINDSVFNSLVSAIEGHDKEAIKNLFSDKAISEDETFDEDLISLLAYCQGPFEYSNSIYSGVDISRQTDGERTQKTICSSHELYKGNVRYQIRICVFVPDITNPNELELMSLYIVKVDDSIDYDYAYKGDGKNTPGINVGVTQPDDYEDL